MLETIRRAFGIKTNKIKENDPNLKQYFVDHVKILDQVVEHQVKVQQQLEEERIRKSKNDTDQWEVTAVETGCEESECYDFVKVEIIFKGECKVMSVETEDQELAMEQNLIHSESYMDEEILQSQEWDVISDETDLELNEFGLVEKIVAGIQIEVPAPIVASKPIKKERTRKVTFSKEIILLEACTRGDLEEVKELMQLGIQSKISLSGQSPIHLAARNGHLELIKMIVESGADVNERDEVHGWTALHECVMRNDVKGVKYLLSVGADLEVEDDEGQSPLCMSQGEVKIILQSALENKYRGNEVMMIYDYYGESFSLTKGQKIKIINRDDNDWWTMETEEGDRMEVPRTYVQ